MTNKILLWNIPLIDFNTRLVSWRFLKQEAMSAHFLIWVEDAQLSMAWISIHSYCRCSCVDVCFMFLLKWQSNETLLFADLFNMKYISNVIFHDRDVDK
jgi:hypothetical protein